MDERPEACPACRGTVLIRSGHACGRQRWKCKGPGCGRQFTRTTPRGKPVEVKQLTTDQISQRAGPAV
jgi:transposase-like protein